MWVMRIWGSCPDRVLSGLLCSRVLHLLTSMVTVWHYVSWSHKKRTMMSLQSSVDVSKLPEKHWFHHASLLSASKLLPASLVATTPPDIIADYLIAPCDGYTVLLIQLCTHLFMKGLVFIFFTSGAWIAQADSSWKIQLHSCLELVVVTGLKQANEKESFTGAWEIAVYSVGPYLYVCTTCWWFSGNGAGFGHEFSALL